MACEAFLFGLLGQTFEFQFDGGAVFSTSRRLQKCK
jgi:hypothetical protein